MAKASSTKAHLITTVALLLPYLAWWLYVIYFFYYKEYDDSNYAAAIASLGVGMLTIAILIGYAVFFLVKARRTNVNKRFYLGTTLLLFLPVVGVAFFEAARSLLVIR